MTSPDDPRRRKIRYRAWHRGFREADLILGPFADTHLERLDDGQLDRLETLMDEADQDIYDWIVGRAATPEAFDHDVMALIRTFRHHAYAARQATDA